MSDDLRTEPLREWNSLTRQITEEAMVSSMFEACFSASEPIEKFSTWLLVGAAAIASFLITSADKLIPLIMHSGFLACGMFLCFSCLCGLISRICALRCNIQIQTGSAVRKTFGQHLAKHQEEEKQILETAAVWNLRLETGVRFDRVENEFLAQFPRWLVWLTSRHLKKHKNNPQIGNILVIKVLQWQALFAFLQALAFLGFLVTGFVCFAGS